MMTVEMEYVLFAMNVACIAVAFVHDSKLKSLGERFKGLDSEVAKVSRFGNGHFRALLKLQEKLDVELFEWKGNRQPADQANQG